MVQKHRHIIVSLLVCNLLIANVGVSMNWVYCYCKGELKTSLFALEEQCEAGNEPKQEQNCCGGSHCEKEEKEVKPCCKKFEKYKKAEKPCTKKGKTFVKADLKFFLSEKENKKTQHIDFQNLITYYYCQNDNENTFESQILSSQAPHAPPPRFYGRNLLNLVQNFRI